MSRSWVGINEPGDLLISAVGEEGEVEDPTDMELMVQETEAVYFTYMGEHRERCGRE